MLKSIFEKYSISMVLRFQLIIICFFCFQSAMALIPGKYDKLFTIGVNVTKPEYSGELGNTIFRFYEKNYWKYWGLGTTFSVNASPSFDIGINGNFASYGYYAGNDHNFLSNKFDMSALVNYKLDNGYILNRENVFSPFLTIGIGFANYSMNPVQKKELNSIDFAERYQPGWDLILPVGAGVQIKFNKTWGFRYQYLYYFTNNDIRDKRSDVKGNDVFGQHLISILYSFGDIQRKDDCKCDY